MGRLNDELPPCDAVSFSAGLAIGPVPYSNHRFLLEANRFEEHAKDYWKAQCAGRRYSPQSQKIVSTWGEGRRRCLIVGAAAKTPSVPDERRDTPGRPACTVVPAAEGEPFSRLAACARGRHGPPPLVDAPESEGTSALSEDLARTRIVVVLEENGSLSFEERDPPNPPPPQPEMREPCACLLATRLGG